MKKLFLLSVVVLLSGSLLAGNADLFSYDQQEVKTEMTSIDELEQYVEQNQGITLDLLKEKNHPLVANVSSNANMMAGVYGPPLGIPSIIWGFCLGPIGLAIVYFVADDSHETKLAFYGCLGALVWSAIFGGYRYGWY